VHYFGEHQLFWAFICLALLSNLVALVGYVARNVESIEGRDGELVPSDLQLKFKQRPEECVLVLMLGIVSTESLCFLSKVRVRVRVKVSIVSTESLCFLSKVRVRVRVRVRVTGANPDPNPNPNPTLTCLCFLLEQHDHKNEP